MTDLFNSVQDLKKSTEESALYGSLGIPIGGEKVVEVPNRSGFVYVRLRDSTSELIQAQNDQVSPVYNLPVILIRRGNKYYIKGRDTERYENWGTFSPFLPRHGDQHSFNPSAGMGGDVTFVYGNQFMPLLTTPSGSNGSGNAILSEYTLQQSTMGWKYVGNTGTPNLLGYRPTGSSSVMVLVYLDTVSGNPGIIVGSGSYFPNSITGNAQIVPYIPTIPNPNWIPSAAIRLSSGTSIIGWDNIYDAKQYYAPISTGTVGGSNLPTFTTGSIPYAGTDGVLRENNTKLMYDEEFGVIWLGGKTIINNSGIELPSYAIFARATGTNGNTGFGVMAVGTGTNGTPSPFYNAYKSRGTYLVPTPVQRGDILWSAGAFGFDGDSWISSARHRMYADNNWVTGSNTSSRHEWELTPSGSFTRRRQMSLYGDSLDIATGTFNIAGVPHDHDNLYREKLTANRTYYVRTDGSDSNTGLVDSAAGAFLTIQQAINTVSSIDIGIFNVTIQVRNGTYTGAIVVTGPWVGSGTVTLVGNITTPPLVFIDVAGTCITVQSGGRLAIQGVKLRATGGGSPALLYATTKGSISISGPIEAGSAVNTHFLTDLGGSISSVEDYTISGGAAAHFGCTSGGLIVFRDQNIFLTGTIAFTFAFASMSRSGVLESFFQTFSGASASGTRYRATSLGNIFVAGGGANYFPGTVAGSVASGGQYN